MTVIASVKRDRKIRTNTSTSHEHGFVPVRRFAAE
jgi:hypothetical protein